MRQWFFVLIFIFLALQLLILGQAKAEYRVYRLGVKSTLNTKEKEKQVITPLDDIQYMGYFQVTNDQQTRIIEHWMCYGRTDHGLKPCRRPNSKVPPLTAATDTTKSLQNSNPQTLPSTVQ